MVQEKIIIEDNNKHIPITLYPTPRGGRTLRLLVDPSRGVRAYVPPRMSVKKVKEFIEEKRNWIIGKCRKIENIKKEERINSKCCRDDTYYLGVRYKIMRARETSSVNQINIDKENKKLFLYINPHSDEKQFMREWFAQKAKEIIIKRIDKILPLPWVQKMPLLRFRYLKSCWGKCKRDSTLTFNIHLVKAPLECIDYVVLHELCHIKEHNHSRRFWKLVEERIPHRKIYEKILKEMGPLFIEE